MKNRNLFGVRHLIRVARIAVILTIVLTVCISGSDSRASEQVMKSYELRMQGKVNEAKSLLDQALAENPNDAEAHFELARTKFYLVMRDIENMEVNFKDHNSPLKKQYKTIRKM